MSAEYDHNGHIGNLAVEVRMDRKQHLNHVVKCEGQTVQIDLVEHILDQTLLVAGQLCVRMEVV